MTRRTFLIATAAAGATPAFAVPAAKMGVATTSFMTARKPRDTYEFLEYCHSLGAGGIQSSLTSLEPEYLKKLRTRAEEWGMYIEVMAGLPKQDDSGAFERTVSGAKQAGALLVRAACLAGRRYETFAKLADWQTFITDSRAAITRALPVVEKHRLPLALENHKDWLADEMVALLKDKSSEYLGVCLDTGNNIALLDDPMMTVEKLAPFALSTHIKDIGVEPYSDGFLLSEMPLGEGILELRKIVSTIHAARPNARMTLETITRNPLEVPCFTEKYWVTFPERSGWNLAKTLVLVRNAARRLESLPRIDRLDPAAQLRLEEDNVKQSLHYAREQLGL